jgi:signal peptidase I
MGEAKRRNPAISFLLSLATPGLGHCYNGNMLRGASLYLGLLLLNIGLGLSGLISDIWGFVYYIAVVIVFLILIATDAAVGADRLKSLELKWYNKWYIYVCIWLVVGYGMSPAIAWVAQRHILGLRPFKVPAAAMEPGLNNGDYFLAKMQRYGSRTPARGDVIVFPYPEDPSKYFVKRVIGLPGEHLQIRNKKVLVHGQPLNDPWGVHNSAETIPGNISQRDNFGPITVTEGSVFVLGDNRDNSHDSRFWGCVETKTIEGKALFVYWSDDKKRIGKKLD